VFKKGNRLFSIATLTLLLVAGLHTMGIFRQPSAPEEIQLVENMKHYRFEGMGMSWSIHDVFISIALTMTIFLVFISLVNFYIIYAVPSRVVRRHITLLDAVFMWILVVLYAAFRIPPPLVSFVLLGILFTASFLLTTKRDRSQ
jgi:hypothetical protein